MAVEDVCGTIFSLVFMIIPLMVFFIPGLLFVLGILGTFIKVIAQYERGILFAFGRFVDVRKPGLNIIIPFYNRMEIIDMRINTLDVPKQEVMTKDSVPVKINAVIYFRVKDPKRALRNVENYMYAVAKYGQTALRNVAGDATLDALLSERKEIAEKLRQIVDVATEPWGIDVTYLELQDIELPESLKRTMAKQAEAEREKRSVIIASEGEVIASDNLVKAANILYNVKGALHLRTLNALNDISSDETNKVVFVVPLEVLRALEEVD
ncbi:MAG: slipin family protein [Candidatus Altiarchaeota archaeon]|nr:slipin family protein [Candidatus Altiarchaeota archaeon]